MRPSRANWLLLPTRFDLHEWAIMDAFARALDDPDLADELLRQIHGLRARKLKSIGPAPDAVLQEVLSLLDACLY